MKLNGREVGFAYTIGAHCDIADYVVAHPDVSAATARLYKAIYMNRAYNEVHDTNTDELTIKELRALPMWQMEEMTAEMDEAEKNDSTRTVEAVEKKQSIAGKK